MNNLISRFVRDEFGATAIEYGLIAALIAVVIITGADHRRHEPVDEVHQRSRPACAKSAAVMSQRTAAPQKAAVRSSRIRHVRANFLCWSCCRLLLAAAAGWDLASFTIPNFLHAGAGRGFRRFSRWRRILRLPAIGLHLLAGLLGLGHRFHAVRAGLYRRRRRQAVRRGGAVAGVCTILLPYALVAIAVRRRADLDAAGAAPIAAAGLPGAPGLDLRCMTTASGIPYGVALAAGAFVILPHTEIFRLAAAIELN